VNVLIPMAGRGKRFAECGFKEPKPLIPVLGRPMYSWAVDGLPLDSTSRLIFVCLREHLKDSALEADIRFRYARFDPQIISLDRVTEGQACTVLAARERIDTEEDLVIFNADTYCPTTLKHALALFGSSVDGVLDVFRGQGTHWSFARTDLAGRVLETAEKRRISEWSTTGLYYFRKGRDFVRHADDMIRSEERSNGEFYVAPVYNRMIAAGADIRINPVDQIWVLGTPEELAAFELQHKKERDEFARPDNSSHPQ
jgi:UDP-N-acetylglucosamine diphosphorylase / glucose-1-phosphate thymidylyltransferase / UDP-N-acetylgalactosamine diphosphorylase / glucosamine-1-phosphate N-acetyltransferase / galactosamine-1-phosphate N-acetyltransferase